MGGPRRKSTEEMPVAPDPAGSRGGTQPRIPADWRARGSASGEIQTKRDATESPPAPSPPPPPPSPSPQRAAAPNANPRDHWSAVGEIGDDLIASEDSPSESGRRRRHTTQPRIPLEDAPSPSPTAAGRTEIATSPTAAGRTEIAMPSATAAGRTEVAVTPAAPAPQTGVPQSPPPSATGYTQPLSVVSSPRTGHTQLLPNSEPDPTPPLAPPPSPQPDEGERVSTQPRVTTLPGAIPFRVPIRGQMIANGQNGVYFIGEHIGSGAYGDVYQCTDEWGNPLVAKVLKPGLPLEEVQRQWQAEVVNLHQMRHPNITYIYDAFIFEQAFYIIVEKCLYSLDRVLHRADPTWVPHIARDVLQALAFVHRLGHVHKDVHVGNIFVSVTTDVMDQQHMPRVQFKLGDLGIARMEDDIRTVGTILAPWMKPPEALDPSTYGRVSKPTDVYHAALLLLAVLRREIYPFTEHEIITGLPRDFAERTGWPAAMALSNALHPVVQRRTQTPLEFWREIQSGLRLAG